MACFPFVEQAYRNECSVEELIAVLLQEPCQWFAFFRPLRGYPLSKNRERPPLTFKVQLTKSSRDGKIDHRIVLYAGHPGYIDPRFGHQSCFCSYW